MKIKLEKQGDKWVVFRTSGGSKTFDKLLPNTITSMSHRVYDPDLGYWLVHITRVKEAVSLANSLKAELDWSTLPKTWQLFIVAGTALPEKKSKKKQDGPYASLFVLPTAPDCVVKASYKALVVYYHPDSGVDGGDSVKLQEVVEAYKLLTKK